MYRQRRRGPSDAYMLLLLAQLVQRIAQLEHKPPVTLGIVAACFLAFYEEVLPPQLRALIPSVSSGCLQPYMIFQNRQWSRVLWAALLHADEMHLYYNMSSLVYKGVLLERRFGSVRFAALLGELLLLSHGLFVGLAAAAAYYVPEYAHLYFSNCAIGISAVLFGLKVVLNHDAPAYSSILGFSLPTKYMAWAELLLASALNPQASFMGHLAGILAGLLHVRLLAPALPYVVRAWRRMQLQARLRLSPGQARLAAADRQQQQRRQQTARGADVAAAARQQGEEPARQRAAQVPSAAAQMQAQQRPVAAAGNRLGQTGAAAATGVSSTAGGGEVVVESSSRAELSAEELRQRRLQRFG